MWMIKAKPGQVKPPKDTGNFGLFVSGTRKASTVSADGIAPAERSTTDKPRFNKDDVVDVEVIDIEPSTYRVLNEEIPTEVEVAVEEPDPAEELPNEQVAERHSAPAKTAESVKAETPEVVKTAGLTVKKLAAKSANVPVKNGNDAAKPEKPSFLSSVLASVRQGKGEKAIAPANKKADTDGESLKSEGTAPLTAENDGATKGKASAAAGLLGRFKAKPAVTPAPDSSSSVESADKKEPAPAASSKKSLADLLKSKNSGSTAGPAHREEPKQSVNKDESESSKGSRNLGLPLVVLSIGVAVWAGYNFQLLTKEKEALASIESDIADLTKKKAGYFLTASDSIARFNAINLDQLSVQAANLWLTRRDVSFEATAQKTTFKVHSNFEKQARIALPGSELASLVELELNSIRSISAPSNCRKQESNNGEQYAITIRFECENTDAAGRSYRRD